MKQLYIILVLFFTAILSAGAFGAVSTDLTGFDLNVDSASDLRSVEATITYTGGADFNALCFSTSDGNDDRACTEMNGPGSPYSVDLSASTVQGISSNTSQGNYTIYAVIRVDDGNFAYYATGINSDAVAIDRGAPVLSSAYPGKNGDYNIDDITFDFDITDAYSALDTAGAVFKVDGAVKAAAASAIADGNNFTFTVNNMDEDDHNVQIIVSDSAGNELNKTLDFTVDTTAPNSIDISSSTAWTNDETPEMAVSASDSGSGMTDGNVLLSCNSSGPWDVFDYPADGNVDGFDITDTDFDCNADGGTKTIHAIFADAAGNRTTSTSTTVKYDNNAPGRPRNLDADAGNKEVDLSWSAPANADDLSGNKAYEVFKDGSHVKTVTSKSTTISGLTNGKEYSFKVRTVDHAGNKSAFTGEKDATPSSGSGDDDDDEGGETTDNSDVDADITVERNGVVVEYAKDGDKLDITAEYSDDIQNARIRYKYYNPNQNTTTLEGPEDDVDSLEADITVDSNYEKICFWTDGSDDDGDDVASETDCVYFDDEKPEIEWKSVPDMNGKPTVSVTAEDNEKVDSVKFYIGGVQVATADKSGTTYSATVDTTKHDNGSHTLKAKVTDGAGNTKEITKSITISNDVSPEGIAQAAIDSAAEAKSVVDDLMKYFASEGIVFPADMAAEKDAADALLAEAKELKNSDPETAKARAETAETKYETINTTAKFEELPDKVAVYEMPAELETALGSLGLTDAQKAEAAGILNEAGVERKLVIVKVGEGENKEYQAKIEITFTNTTDSSQLKIIEVVPKEIAETAAEIFSDYNFVILQNDPVIEFTVDVAGGASKTITYGIGSMTQENAEAMITNNVIANFASPPVLLTAAMDTSNLQEGLDLTMIITYALAAIVIVIIVGIVVFLSLQQEQNPFGPKKGGFMGKLKGMGGKKGKENGGKWAYGKK